MTRIKGTLTAVIIIHKIFQGEFIYEFIKSQNMPVIQYVNQAVVEPASMFICCVCTRGAIYTLQPFIPRKLHFLINGGLIPIIISQKIFYDYFLENFQESLKIQKVNFFLKKKDKLLWPLCGAVLFGIWTIFIKAKIKLDKEFRAQVDKKLDWMSENCGVKGFKLPKCTTCEVPYFMRAHHCGVCGHCVGKYEVHSSVLNVCIGAKNILPYFAFYCCLGLYHLRVCDIVTKKLFKKMGKFELILVSYFVLFTTVHSLKEVVLIALSILTNTTNKERDDNFRKIYFKAKGNMRTNPFTKGIIKNVIETIVIFLGSKTIVEPYKQLPDVEIEEDGTPGEEFFEQLNFDITEGIYDWSREFIYSMLEIDCDARDLAIRVLKAKRKKGTAFDSDESFSSDSDGDCGHCGNDDCGTHAQNNQTNRFQGEKYQRPKIDPSVDIVNKTENEKKIESVGGDVQLTETQLEKPDEETLDLLS